MTTERTVVMEITTIEAAHLADLVEQFQDLLASEEPGSDTPDAAIARLTPDPYPDDPEASRELQRLTRAELLRRRSDDAGVVLRSLFPERRPPVGSLADDVFLEPIVVLLAHDEATAWMRTLAAVRLVLGSRLGITSEQDHDDDPRFAVYEWLALRLDGLVRALDELDARER